MARTTYITARDMLAGADTDLQAIVYGALIKLANDIVNEAPTTNGHPVRRRWAERVRRDPTFAMKPALIACAFNAGIRTKYASDPATLTDAEVETVLSAALWQLIAEALAA